MQALSLSGLPRVSTFNDCCVHATDVLVYGRGSYGWLLLVIQRGAAAYENYEPFRWVDRKANADSSCYGKIAAAFLSCCYRAAVRMYRDSLFTRCIYWILVYLLQINQ